MGVSPRAEEWPRHQRAAERRAACGIDVAASRPTWFSKSGPKTPQKSRGAAGRVWVIAAPQLGGFLLEQRSPWAHCPRLNDVAPLSGQSDATG